ncbi:ABC transporter substrate-binding protein [Rhodococcus hoagii]|uniref:ABC transporter substrate-binding protein n=1 Tax=Rhodococcus hoagii TaxID=43767 RepID=UPI0019637C91|nr:ABC transporter substrate-binding protein [Prescottella equi]MBM9836403.1 ABC transporter substrate-binding protein [Prescottella equi]NKR54971.1 ABC transporter substrate-binding protein [Prescottella equi]
MPVIESTKTDARLGDWNGDIRRPTSARTTRDMDREFGTLVDALTRRGFLTGAAALGALGALSACSTRPGNSATSDASVEIVVGDERYRLPRDPQRVVVLEARAALDFALLAEYPIVATNWDDRSQLMQRVPAGTERLGGTNNEPNAEAILGYEPDLLVVGQGWWDYYRERGLLGTDIAPVLVVDQGTPGSTWKRAMTEQLTALDRRDVADRVVARYNAELAQARAAMAGLLDGKTIAIAGADKGQLWLQNDTFAVSVARDLGLDVLTDPAHASADNRGITFYALEQLDIFEQADFVLLQNPDAAEAQSPTWKRVRAVRDGHVGQLRYDLNSGLALTAMALAADIAEQVQVMR